MKKVYPKEDVCIGCRLCEIHCLVQHSKSKDIIKAFKKEFPRALKRIRVEEKRPVSFAVQCRIAVTHLVLQHALQGRCPKMREGQCFTILINVSAVGRASWYAHLVQFRLIRGVRG